MNAPPQHQSIKNRSAGKAALVAVLAVMAATVLILAGRATVDPESAHDAGYQAGHGDGYAEGLAAGEAHGLQEGRALQEGIALPPESRAPVDDAFNSGYAAGANDAFNQYDGGWSIGSPYVITLQEGSGGVTYRIGSRVAVQAGVDYYLCPDGHSLCQQSRP